jgi:hypothetical protein
VGVPLLRLYELLILKVLAAGVLVAWVPDASEWDTIGGWLEFGHGVESSTRRESEEFGVQVEGSLPLSMAAVDGPTQYGTLMNTRPTVNGRSTIAIPPTVATAPATQAARRLAVHQLNREPSDPCSTQTLSRRRTGLRR